MAFSVFPHLAVLPFISPIHLTNVTLLILTVENNKNQKNINVLRSFMESIIKIIKDSEPNHQYRIYKLSAKRSDIFDFRVHSNHLSQVDIADEIYKQCQQFLRISQVQLKNDVHFIKIDRCSTFNTVLRTVNSLRTNYGKRNHNDKVVIINPISRDNQTEFDILRSYLIAIFVERFLASSGYKTFLGVKKKFSEHIQVLSGNFFQGNFDDERKELISQVKSSKYVFEEADCIKLNARRFFEDKTAQAALDLPLFDSQINEIPLIQNGVPTSVLEETIKISNMTLKLDEPLMLQIVPQNLVFLATQINTTDEVLRSSNVKKSQIIHGPVKVMSCETQSDNVSVYFEKSLEACRNEAQYKYGNDIDLISWDHTLKVLSDANIKFEFLATKCSAPLKIGICLSKSSGPKGKFVIYNYARISMMLSKFYQLVNQGYYPKLPSIDEIDFNLLDHQLEWKLLFDYVLFFPHLLQEVLDVENLTELPIHKIPHFLLSMSEDISSYYSKVHLLTKPLNHLMPTMYARLYLMMAVKQVMHNALCIMNIAEVQQM